MRCLLLIRNVNENQQNSSGKYDSCPEVAAFDRLSEEDGFLDEENNILSKRMNVISVARQGSEGMTFLYNK